MLCKKNEASNVSLGELKWKILKAETLLGSNLSQRQDGVICVIRYVKLCLDK